MPREDYTHKMVNGERVELTEAEIDECMAREEAHNAEVAAAEAAKPMNDWLAAMEESDKEVSRVVEDIFDVMTQEQKDAMPAFSKAKIADKKVLRGTKP